MTDTEAAKADDELVERLKDGAFCFGSEVCDTNPQNCPCSQRKKAAAAITRLRAELAEEHARFDKWHTKAAEEHALRLAAEAERDSAVQRADLLTKELADVRLSEENDALIDALAAERAARERMRGLLRDCRCPRPANTAPDYTTVGECLSRLECGCTYGSALSAPAEASAGEAGRTFTDEMVEAGARELVRIEHAKHPWAHYMICSRAVLSAALNIHARPAQKDSEG
jgi:hypothetical protein